MTTQEAAMRKALEYIEGATAGLLAKMDAIESLRTALAQQGEQPDQRLVNLLCRIHRDGGHYIAKHGIDKAVIDADVRVAQLNALTDTAAPAPQPAQEQEQVGINGLTEAETSATMSVLGLSEPAQGNAELIARSTKVAAELDDFNSSLDRKATKCIRELLTALQSAQPAVANIQTKIVKDISAHEGGKQQLPPLPTTEPDARGCAYCNHTLFLGSKCKNCGRRVADLQSDAQIDADIAKATEKGAEAWAGVDPQELRTGLVPLTDVQINVLWDDAFIASDPTANNHRFKFARALEAAHGIGVGNTIEK